MLSLLVGLSLWVFWLLRDVNATALPQGAGEGAEDQAAAAADDETGGETAGASQPGGGDMETEARTGADAAEVAGTAEAGDQATAGDADDGEGAADVAMIGDAQPAEAQEGGEEADPEMAWAGRLLGVLKARRPAMDQTERGGGQFNREVPFTAVEVMQWVDNSKVCGSGVGEEQS